MKANLTYYLGLSRHDQTFEHDELNWFVNDHGDLIIKFDNKTVATYKAEQWKCIVQETN